MRKSLEPSADSCPADMAAAAAAAAAADAAAACCCLLDWASSRSPAAAVAGETDLGAAATKL
jgi:hypothetical protein